MSGVIVGRNLGIKPAVVDTAGMGEDMKRTLTERNYEAPKRNRPNVLARMRERVKHMGTPFQDLADQAPEVETEIQKKKNLNAGLRYFKKKGY